MTFVYFVRHGESVVNITKEFSYKLVDYSLTPKGKLQAQQTAEYFKNKKIDNIFSSPLKRAVETAKIIAKILKLKVKVIENFREINVGVLEGQIVNKENWDTYLSIINDWYEGNHKSRFPQGDDYDTLLTRMFNGLKQAVGKNENKNVIIVGHGGMLMATIKDICQNADIRELKKTDVPNCSITKFKISVSNGEFTGELMSWTEMTHLYGKASKVISGLPEYVNKE
ncbi:MAG: histidine phosphatase family protein [Promethearchaeota archaeon]